MRLNLILPQVILSSNENSPVSLEFDENTESLRSSLELFLGDKFDVLFEKDGTTKGFARIFYNDQLVNSLNDIDCSNDGEIEIIASMSGG